MSKPKIEITCELGFSDGRRMTADESRRIEKALRRIVAETYPGAKVRACWVHKALRYSGDA